MRKRGIVADTSYNAAVWNYPICGYEMSRQAGSFFKSRIHVTTTVWYADDGVDPEFLGTQHMKKTYHYTLNINRNGEVTGGMWDLRSQFDHPDFVWIPLSDTPPQGDEKPRLDPKLVRAIVQAGSGRTPHGTPESGPSFDTLLAEAGVNPSDYFN